MYGEEKRQAKERLLSVTPQLRAANIGYVIAFYDGSGDEGSIEAVVFIGIGKMEEASVYDLRSEYEVRGEGIACPQSIKHSDMQEAMDTLCPDGYENNLGGFGAVILDVERNKIHVNYSYRVECSEDSDFEVD